MTPRHRGPTQYHPNVPLLRWVTKTHLKAAAAALFGVLALGGTSVFLAETIAPDPPARAVVEPPPVAVFPDEPHGGVQASEPVLETPPASTLKSPKPAQARNTVPRIIAPRPDPPPQVVIITVPAQPVPTPPPVVEPVPEPVVPVPDEPVAPPKRLAGHDKDWQNTPTRTPRWDRGPATEPTVDQQSGLCAAGVCVDFGGQPTRSHRSNPSTTEETRHDR